MKRKSKTPSSQSQSTKSEIKVKRPFQGIWVPKEIWLDNGLTLLEKLFLIEINGLNNDNGCFASNAHFSSFFGVSKSRCSQIINSLKEKKYIKIQLERDGKLIKKRVIKVFNFLKGGIKFSKGGYLENYKDINIKNIKPINNIIIEKNPKKSKKFDPILQIKNKLSSSNLIELTDQETIQTIQDWVNYRGSIKKPIKTEQGVSLFVNKFKEFGQESMVQAIQDSIEYGWVGLFPKKDTGVMSNEINRGIRKRNNSNAPEDEYEGLRKPEYKSWKDMQD